MDDGTGLRDCVEGEPRSWPLKLPKRGVFFLFTLGDDFFLLQSPINPLSIAYPGLNFTTLSLHI